MIIREIPHRTENWSSILPSLSKEWLQILGTQKDGYTQDNEDKLPLSAAQLNGVNFSFIQYLLRAYCVQGLALDTRYMDMYDSKGHSGIV